MKANNSATAIKINEAAAPAPTTKSILFLGFSNSIGWEEKNTQFPISSTDIVYVL